MLFKLTTSLNSKIFLSGVQDHISNNIFKNIYRVLFAVGDITFFFKFLYTSPLSWLVNEKLQAASKFKITNNEHLGETQGEACVCMRVSWAENTGKTLQHCQKKRSIQHCVNWGIKNTDYDNHYYWKDTIFFTTLDFIS